MDKIPAHNELLLHPVAYAHNGFSAKFGIPRQSREDSCILTRIVFEKPYRQPEAIRGLDGYDYLWLLWGFSQVPDNLPSLTVRPPRLGGNTRMGVFATRSPFRPNPIGLTSVRLVRIEETSDQGLVLVVSGADLLDGTPIYDIKPYITYSDVHADARSGFGVATKDYHLRVQWPPDVLPLINSRLAEWEEILSQDPRPSYQDDPDRVYGITYAGINLHFRVQSDTLYVLDASHQ